MGHVLVVLVFVAVVVGVWGVEFCKRSVRFFHFLFSLHHDGGNTRGGVVVFMMVVGSGRLSSPPRSPHNTYPLPGHSHHSLATPTQYHGSGRRAAHGRDGEGGDGSDGGDSGGVYYKLGLTVLGIVALLNILATHR